MIAIVDRIGAHSGMHYFDSAFVREGRRRGVALQVVSNFSDPSEGINAAFPNFYTGGRLAKFLRFFRFLVTITAFALGRRRTLIVYYSFGEWIDLVVLRILGFITKNIVLDIHEVVKLDDSGNSRLQAAFARYYSHLDRAVIVHSQRSHDTLDRFGYRGTRLSVPHFRYMFSKNFREEAISESMKSAVRSDCRNILFFGHIRESKGIDLFVEAAKILLGGAVGTEFHFVVAGADPDGLLEKLQIPSEGFSVVARRITDDELNFLFSYCDALVLPYREVSQSGVIEAAVYFRRPVIVSNLPYFQDFLARYPSFGCCTDSTSAGDLADAIRVTMQNRLVFYAQEDVARYENNPAINEFFSVLSGLAQTGRFSVCAKIG